MFYYNVGYQSSMLQSVPVEGVILRASAQTSGHLEERDYALPSSVLFDPQLYWLDLPLDPTANQPLIARLSSYPWFGIPAEARDGAPITAWFGRLKEAAESNWANRTDPRQSWDQAVAAAVQTQLGVGVTKVILPSFLISNPHDDLDQYFALQNAAVKKAREVTDLPLLATIALNDRAVYHDDPSESLLLDALADGVSAAEDLDGAYVIVAAESMSRERHVTKNVVGSVLWLSKALGGDVGQDVIVNFVECLGLAACAFGASGYGSGYSRKSKRLCLDDYGQGGGPGYPSFHSLNYVLDLRPERDLERIRDLRLLPRLAGDRTTTSAPLLDALDQGGNARDVVEWAENPNNLTRAREHYARRHANGAHHGADPESALDWLQSAEENWVYLLNRTEEDPLQCDGTHLASWRAAVEMILNG